MDGVHIIKKTWQDPSQRPPRGATIPILMGGVGEKRHLPLVAREADEWDYTRLDHDEYRHKRQVIAESCREIGSDPSTIRYSVMANYIVGRDLDELRQRAVQMAEVLPRLKRDSPDEILDVARKSAFVGTPAAVAEQIRSFAAL